MLSGGIGYDDRGSGRAVVMLHPFPSDRGLWNGLAEALAPRCRVVTVDARGFGESTARGSFSIADLADDVAALLAERGIDKATLLGMSMGGYAALAFAQRHPARLEALILADTRAAADSDAARAGRAAALAQIRGEGAAAYLAASLPRLLSPQAPPALVTFLRARAETRAASLIAGVEALRDRPDRSQELGAIRCPTLVLGGDAEQVIPSSEMKAMADAIPSARFTALAGAGHLSHLEAPGPFERAVASFLGLPEGAGR
jgi:pimeloyl-ACP methyl ester carboxylesterase